MKISGIPLYRRMKGDEVTAYFGMTVIILFLQDINPGSSSLLIAFWQSFGVGFFFYLN
jgi:hypothetical protein